MSAAFACKTGDELHARGVELSREIVAHRQCALVNHRAGPEGAAWMHECHAGRKEQQVIWIAQQAEYLCSKGVA